MAYISWFSDSSFYFFALKSILVLLAKCNSGELHCPATALIERSLWYLLHFKANSQGSADESSHPPSPNSLCCLNKQYEPPHDKTNKMACAPSKDSDQPGHPSSLIRVQADLSLRWAHMPFCWFCHEVAEIMELKEASDKQPYIWPNFMAVHVPLKFQYLYETMGLLSHYMAILEGSLWYCF